jgi:peptide/nickel transport system substrate-binding protein
VSGLVAGCGGSSDGGTGSAASGKTKMVFLTSSFAPDLDVASQLTITMAQLLPQLYSGLIDIPYSSDGDVEMPNYQAGPMDYAPALAESYTQDGNTWTFKLRNDATSCAGNPLTADDVVYTFERHASQTGPVNAPFYFYSSSGLFDPTAKELNGAVKKIDDHTVAFTTTGPSIRWPLALTDRSFGGIFDSKEMKAHATAKDPYSDAWLQKGNSAGFGPYCVKEMDAKSNQVTLEANPGYWGEKPQMQTVVVRGVPDASTRLQAVRSGDADGTTDLAPTEYESLASFASVYSVENGQVMWLTLNSKYEPWSGPEGALLRQAVAAALPYDILQAGPLKGAASPLAGIIAPVYRGAAEFAAPQQDVEKAKQLLAQAGYPDGQGLDKFKEGLTLYIDTDSNGAFAPQMANQIRTALDAVGIPIEIQNLTSADFQTRLYREKDLPMSIAVLNPGNVPDAVAATATFFGGLAAGGTVNITGYTNPDFDSLATKTLGTEPGSTEYTDGAKELQQIVWDDLPVIPLGQLKSQIVLAKGLGGWAPGPLTPVPTFWTFKDVK